VDESVSLEVISNEGEQLLAYRLRKGVTLDLDFGPKPVLVLDFPLRAISVHPSWSPVLKRLASSDFVSIEEIASCTPQIPLEKTEQFMEYLVRKAFCERRGLLPLRDYPSVSIIIPVRNRRGDLSGCLESLTHLKYQPGKTEIIVVDDASDDDSRHVASKFPVRVFSLRTHKQVSYCRNFAARRAKGEILAFIDSDCVAHPLWLKQLVPSFRDPQVGAVGGLVDSDSDKNALDRYEKVKSSLQVSTWFKRSTDEEPFFYVPSCNLLVRRDLFLKLEGFKEDLHVGEDVDLCWRLQDYGKILEYRPVGTVYHKHRNSLWPFCRRRFQYGTSEPILQRLHTDRIKQLRLPLSELMVWILIAASALLGCAPLLGAAGAILLLDGLSRHARIRKERLPIPFVATFMAVVRSCLSLLYHLCTFVSRYFLILFIALFPLIPYPSAGVFCMHLISGVVQHRTKKPQLNLLAFLALFTLEQLSYQSGVWWGCFRGACVTPLFPRLVFERNPLSRVREYKVTTGRDGQ